MSTISTINLEVYMEDTIFKICIFIVGITSLYHLVIAKSFFRRLALLATICSGVVVYVVLSSTEFSGDRWVENGALYSWSEMLAITGIVGLVFLIISMILDWLFSGD